MDTTFKLTNRGQDIELQPSVDSCRIDTLIQNHEIDLLLFKSLDDHGQINVRTCQAIKFSDDKNTFIPNKIQGLL
jgi:hypothetical protein